MSKEIISATIVGKVWYVEGHQGHYLSWMVMGFASQHEAEDYCRKCNDYVRSAPDPRQRGHQQYLAGNPYDRTGNAYSSHLTSPHYYVGELPFGGMTT